VYGFILSGLLGIHLLVVYLLEILANEALNPTKKTPFLERPRVHACILIDQKKRTGTSLRQASRANATGVKVGVFSCFWLQFCTYIG
jgi:hypothetical protein